MKIPQKDKHDGSVSPDFKTMAVMDEALKTKDAKVTIPTELGVREARHFIEENQK